MQLQVVEDYKAMSILAAEKISGFINKKADSLLCLAAGDTPLETYQALTQFHLEGNVGLNQCKFVGLDEWVGLSGEDEGSCLFTMNHHLFRPNAIEDGCIRFFDGKKLDLQTECKLVDDFIVANGGRCHAFGTWCQRPPWI